AGDFRAYAAAHEFAHGFTRAQELSGEIDGQHLVPLRERELVERGILLQARVVDQDVHGAELFQHRAEHRAHLSLIRHISAQSAHPYAPGAYLVRESFSLILVTHIIDDDIGAGIAERQGDGASDTRTRASHECLLPKQQLLGWYA